MFLWALLQHPEVAQAVRAHPALAGAAVGESLNFSAQRIRQLINSDSV